MYMSGVHLVKPVASVAGLKVEFSFSVQMNTSGKSLLNG